MPLTLATSLRTFVTSSSRSRGEAYFRAGRVIPRRADATSFNAAVSGTRSYDVSLLVDGDRLLADCTCPYFAGTREPCKHIWATILAADEARRLTLTGDLWLDVGEEELGVEETDQVSAGSSDLRLSPQGETPAFPSRLPPPPAWQVFLSRVTPPPEAIFTRLPTGELIYVLDLARSSTLGGLSIDLMTRDRKKSGDWGKPKALSINRNDAAQLADDRDRQILEAIAGARHAYAYTAPAWSGFREGTLPTSFVLGPTLQRDLGPRLCETGRFVVRLPDSAGARPETALTPVEWDPNLAEFHLRVSGDATAGYTVTGVVLRDGSEHPFADALFVTTASMLWRPSGPDARPRLAAFDPGGANRWMAGLFEFGSVTVPASEATALVETLAASDLVRLQSPEEIRVETATVPPRPILRVSSPPAEYPRYASRDRLEATLTFAYGGVEAGVWSTSPVLFDRARHLAWRRDPAAERQALTRLQALGVRTFADWQGGGTRLDLAASMLPPLVAALVREGWKIEADGRIYRPAGSVTLNVRSGIDWFELHGSVDYEGMSADLPALLAAARRGESFVRLGDGSFGVMPADWLARHGRITALGVAETDHVRFASSQGALLDAWLATQPAVSCDETFARVRQELVSFKGVEAVEPPPSFRGTLRDYQADALAWFEFLRRFGFGGCLADEMGLGKTVMVLAALEARREQRQREGRSSQSSLIVVPRSLVFNWQREAARFAPGLRVLDYSGQGRRDSLDELAEHDIVLTTYGTLRRDIGHLKDVEFDYVILDEAQAIKNATTTSAKAARLLRAKHRLALTGTPVENHLGELWSLFDFLNPGLLGAASIFNAAGEYGQGADPEMLEVLARGLRPFILRRTKDQVASELPARTEQTLYCELEAPQRALYAELRAHYRASLLGTIGPDGLPRKKLQILEALLRLRQAACHPGLVDPARASEPAAKLDVLLPRLRELVEDGRKAVVFSQFTSLLALLRQRLDEAGLIYEYLDGKTRDREARVKRFQTEDCPLFLISLKAGGLGLNLTAAEYVFLLDPWWNPAVEAQAIDRAHRIGQTRPVFAFRLIARDTVEEKVLELQAGKRQLADAVVRADRSLIRNLRREDLELLLS